MDNHLTSIRHNPRRCSCGRMKIGRVCSKGQPQPLRIKVTAGPLAKGDLDPQPHVGYLDVQVEPAD